MPSAKKSKSKSRNTSTHKTRCRFCREKCVGKNVCKKCVDTNPHYKLEILEDAMEKGKINEGEYLRRCKHLKEEKELEELAKGISTFDTLVSGELVREEDIPNLPEGGTAIRVPPHISAMGMRAVIRYGEQLNRENTAMNEFMEQIASFMNGRMLNLEEADRYCRMVVDANIQRLRNIFTDTGMNYLDAPEFHDWLINSYNANINQRLMRVGFPEYYDENVEFIFEWTRDSNGLICSIKATIEDENSYHTTSIAHLHWQRGGHFGRSNFSN